MTAEGRHLPVAEVSPNPRNPREHFDDGAIGDLADSIAEQGLLQPVLVRPAGDGYELVHGERRLRAVRSLDRETIRAEVRELSDREALEISITENLQREDVSPLAEARSYRALIDEFELTQAEAADRLGKSQSHISNQLKLLDLPDRLQRFILRKILTPWQAREIHKVWGHYWIVDLVIDHDLSVEETRRVVTQLERGEEYIRVSRQWPLDVLEAYCEADDERFRAPHLREPEKTISDIEVTHSLNWAAENLAGFEGLGDLDHLSDLEVDPILFHWPANTVILGHRRIDLAVKEGYIGDLEVDLLFPSEMYAWDVRLRDADQDPEEEEEVE